jgi:hypothetical protein
LKILKNCESFEVHPVNTQKLWKIISKDEFFPLSEGQFIKIGRKMFKIHLKLPVFQAKNLSENLQENCRICFQTSSKEDPLISPCDCKGSIKFAHLTCFENYIRPFVKVEKSSGMTRFKVTSLFCEISKCRVHRKMLKKTLIFGILKKFQFKEDYFILEYFDRDKEYSIFVLEIGGFGEVVVGRRTGAGLAVFDISVSREHCVFRCVDGKIQVSDLGSRYGTLVSFKSIRVEKDEVNIQMNNQVFSLRTQEKRIHVF